MDFVRPQALHQHASEEGGYLLAPSTREGLMWCSTKSPKCWSSGPTTDCTLAAAATILAMVVPTAAAAAAATTATATAAVVLTEVIVSLTVPEAVPEAVAPLILTLLFVAIAIPRSLGCRHGYMLMRLG